MFYLNKILYFVLILFLLIGIWGFFLNSNPSNQIIKKPHLPSLEIGDLVFRAGIGSESFL
ncbi:membrane protein, partial [Campylobacter jejuni CVM 41905]